MAEVGLLPSARIALQVAKAVLPRYRSRFSKHQFTQPQLLAIRGLTSVPDFTTLYRFPKSSQPRLHFSYNRVCQMGLHELVNASLRSPAIIPTLEIALHFGFFARLSDICGSHCPNLTFLFEFYARRSLRPNIQSDVPVDL